MQRRAENWRGSRKQCGGFCLFRFRYIFMKIMQRENGKCLGQVNPYLFSSASQYMQFYILVLLAQQIMSLISMTSEVIRGLIVAFSYPDQCDHFEYNVYRAWSLIPL